ncbi:HERV-H LTR-associating protein 1 [Eumetopias jubatus]|uniref:HERV-H LTR-associating protein 1 n=1 Tax=Eumetopias jubatus TaxID=34886 RepID=UPI00101681E4|nr:HERV-H LTR-associating protein 1 [Eumetopias jubatus]
MPGFLVPCPPVRLCVGLTCVLSLWNTVSAVKGEAKKEKVMTFLPTTAPGLGEERKEKGVAFLDTTELPARSVDLSALNLTELVNGMLNRALKDTKFFSLLSITSYSSFAFHKFSVTIYNISNLKTVDATRFPTRYCYCLNNRTNDLSDFTALLVDVIGNSTSYLTEIFKSTSILSVSQTNESDCIFICVMTGKSGRNLSDFWEMAEKSPVINYTFTSSMSGVLGESPRGTAVTSKLTPTSQQTLQRTSRLHGAQSTGAPAPRTSPWTEATSPADGQQAVSTDRLLELRARATAMATQGSAPRTLPALGAATLTPCLRHAMPLPCISSFHTSISWFPVASDTMYHSYPQDLPISYATLDEPLLQVLSLTQFCILTALPGTALPGTSTHGTQTPSPTKALAPKYPQKGDLPATWPFTPGEEPALVPGPHQVSRCPQLLLEEGAITTIPLTLAIQKLNPCLMELCRFFQQCLCISRKRETRTEAMRYCLEYYSWFLKNATYICQRVKRVPHSHTLKQKCLQNICQSV